MRAKTFRTVSSTVQQRRRGSLTYNGKLSPVSENEIAETLVLAFAEDEGADDIHYSFAEPLRKAG
jgi:hypothetical protein